MRRPGRGCGPWPWSRLPGSCGAGRDRTSHGGCRASSARSRWPRSRAVCELCCRWERPIARLWSTGRWLGDEGLAAGTARMCVIAALSLVAGTIAHSRFWFVACFALALIGVVAAAWVGLVQDWDEDHQERLTDFRSGQDGTVWGDIARDVGSPSPADRAEAYRKLVEQFGGLYTQSGNTPE
ncbi:DUF3742 family protein [Streptomyces sp. NPDC014991]|uniref:DUF3742 family protein n=1 Tax=Streptomyces sp. NPDC014991 TaxID=3364935 RepID=UPI0036F7E339